MQIRDPCVWTSPWIRFAFHGTVRDFRECFGKSLYGRNLLLTIQNLFLLPRHIRFSTNEGVNLPRDTANMQKILEVCVCCCACVYGESLLTSGERVIQKKTLNPFVLAQSGWMLYYNNE